MASQPRGNHGFRRFFEEGAYNIAWNSFMGGISMLGRLGGKWLQEGGAEKIMDSILREAKEEGHREAWNIAQNLEEPYGRFVIDVRKYVSQSPAGDRNLMRNLGLMYIALINGYANSHDVKRLVKEVTEETSSDKKKITRETVEESSFSEEEGLSLFKNSLKRMIDYSLEGEDVSKQYDAFVFLLSGFSNHAVGAMFASMKFWASKIVQNVLPENLKGKDLGEIAGFFKKNFDTFTSRLSGWSAEFLTDFTKGFNEVSEELVIKDALLRDPPRPTAVGNFFRNRVKRNRGKK